MELLASLHSPAKINLGLWITGRREDGYHEIVTVFHRIAFHDVIKIWKSDEFQIKCSRCPEDESNILYKVKKLFESRFHVDINFYIEIHKNIPPGSGLGGASSNAATFMKFLNKKFELGLSTRELIRLGREVGADVPFFLSEYNACIATGIGDILEPIDSGMKSPLYLKIPPVEVSTAWAYRKIDEEGIFTTSKEAYNRALQIAKALQENDLQGLFHVENVFEKVVFKTYPEIEDAKEELYLLGARVASMSGTGSCVFGIFERFINIEGADLIESRLGGEVG